MILYVDNFCEITRFLHPHITEVFYDITKLPANPDAVYVVGRVQMKDNAAAVRNLIDIGAQVIFSNPAEGSETFVNHLRAYGVQDLALSGKLKCVVGGSMPPEYNCIRFEHFLTQPFRFDENHAAITRTNEIFSKKEKPYKFLFLNGRYRAHRRELIHQLGELNLLKDALWTNLDGTELPIKLLPEYYEVDQYCNNMNAAHTGFAKYELFNNEWGEIYIKPEPYIDTYFSLVTETIFHYPHSFFTEKIAKPLAMGHPFIAASNQYFYRDLRNLGFRTFNSIFDESFDNIDNASDRLARIKDTVADLCYNDLSKMLAAAEPICKYNQQHLLELAPKLMAEFSPRFFNFIK